MAQRVTCGIVVKKAEDMTREEREALGCGDPEEMVICIEGCNGYCVSTYY